MRRPKKNRIVLVVSRKPWDLCFDNDLGGTECAPIGSYRIKIDRTFQDYETGRRGVGVLVDEKDIETLRQLGTTAFFPKKVDWNPAKVYFSMLGVSSA